MAIGRLDKKFFQRDALAVAPDLMGKTLVRNFGNGETLRLTLTELEIYRGEEDLACHASKGRTPRTEALYGDGGVVYVYLIYGIHWLLNFVTGPIGQPQAILIRGSKEIQGPGRIGRALNLDKSFYGEELSCSQRLWLEGSTAETHRFTASPRIGVDYAGPEWSLKPWRYTLLKK
jgi:DNA-3-methyladenine glycosylase